MLTVFSHKRVLSGYTNDELVLLRKTKESSLKTLWLFTAPCNKTVLEKIIKLIIVVNKRRVIEAIT